MNKACKGRRIYIDIVKHNYYLILIYKHAVNRSIFKYLFSQRVAIIANYLGLSHVTIKINKLVLI